MLIHVTQDDIARGKPGSGCYCAVGPALARTLGGFGQWGVLVSGIYKGQFGDGALMASTPRSVRRFMMRFDSGQPVKPFAFRFNPS